MSKTLKLSDGTKLTTGSQRRFVVFAIGDDSHAQIVKRSDSLATALAAFDSTKRGTCRTVVVDFDAPKVVRDTADDIGPSRDRGPTPLLSKLMNDTFGGLGR